MYFTINVLVGSSYVPVALSAAVCEPGSGPWAQEQRSQVVSPSGVTRSSRNAGRGGGGKKPLDQSPPSPSKGRVQVVSASRAPSHQSDDGNGGGGPVSPSEDIPTPETSRKRLHRLKNDY